MNKTVSFILLILGTVVIPWSHLSSQDRFSSNAGVEFTLEQVAHDLEHPWAISVLPDGRMLVTERPGRMHILEGTTLTRVQGLPEIRAFGQGGLLDVVAHPEFEQNRLVYFTFADLRNGRAGTAVGRGRLENATLQEVETIFTLDPKTQRRQHFGSRLLFLPDGTLLFTIGDRGWPDAAQDTMDHAGSTLRINDDGSVPEDNPFVDDPDYHPELYTIGNRNAQGMAMDPSTGEIWQSEHGPRGGDELNHILPGNNYGWPVISHGVDYRTGEQIGVGRSAPGMEEPVAYWSPAIAPSGITFYDGEAFPQWHGDLFVASLVDRHLRRVRIRNRRVIEEEILLHNRIGRIRDVTVGYDGYIYLVTDSRRGGVYRLR